MSDPNVTSLFGSAGHISNALETYLPGITQAITGQYTPTAEAQLGAAQAVSPGYADLMSKLYSQYAPGLATTGANVDAISREGAAGTDLSLLQTYGPQLAAAQRASENALNPEVAAARASAAKGLGDLFGSINLNSPNPEAERLVSQESARSGNIAQPSATNTVSNALSFGNELQKRRDALGKAISLATGFTQAGQTSFNPVANALTRSPSNTGTSQFTGIDKDTAAAQQTGTDWLTQLSQLQGQKVDLSSQRRATGALSNFQSTIPT